MKRNIFLTLLGVLALGFGITSCEKLDSLDDYKSVDVGGTATAKLSGEYFIHLDYYDAGTSTWVLDGFGIGYKKIIISNTAANKADSVWINDLNIWPTLARVSCNSTTGVFNPGVSDNIQDAGETFEVMNGKVLTEGCVTESGNKSDSIYIEFVWSDIAAANLPAGTLTRFSGYKRTGFIEDEH